jgi:hypothetical protein
MTNQIYKKRTNFMPSKSRHQCTDLLSLMIVCITFAAVCPPGQCASKDKLWQSVPVFYATSRQYDKDHDVYSGRRNPEHENQGVEYGIVTSVIPVIAATNLSHFILSQREQRTLRNHECGRIGTTTRFGRDTD